MRGSGTRAFCLRSVTALLMMSDGGVALVYCQNQLVDRVLQVEQLQMRLERELRVGAETGEVSSDVSGATAARSKALDVGPLQARDIEHKSMARGGKLGMLASSHAGNRAPRLRSVNDGGWIFFQIGENQAVEPLRAEHCVRAQENPRRPHR